MSNSSILFLLFFSKQKIHIVFILYHILEKMSTGFSLFSGVFEDFFIFSGVEMT